MTEDSPTRNAFLGGALQIWQPAAGYRAGIDAVLLASAINAKTGQTILDLGCGVGVAGLSLARRVPGVQIVGLEREPVYARLAQRNAHENGIPAEIVEGDLADMPAVLRDRQFDHVILNPPYYDRDHGPPSSRSLREAALGEQTPLEQWLRVAAKRTRPGGHVTLVQRAERLPDCLAHLPAPMGSTEVLPFLPRAGRPAHLFLMRARHGGRAPFRLYTGCVIHAGAKHERDGEDYTKRVSDVLRAPGALIFG